MVNHKTVKLLFVCSMNHWRSPTAERIYADRPLVQARSCGTSKTARKKVAADELKWADIVLVMEDKHKRRLMADYPGQMRFKELHVLHIPDIYKYMDPELIEEISQSVEPILMQKMG